MRTTRYFEEQVMRKRPYLRREWIEKALAEPVACARREDGRVRLWSRVESAPPDAAPRFLRVVLLEDSETVHNAFFDRNFEPPRAEDAR